MGELSATHKRRPWRENLEALAMAIVVALLFKYFILEISKIPSGSMQPTLMGNREGGVFDRVLVDKLSMRFRDPQRFEIVVFKHPLERSRIMVKRLVGMPDEDLKIEYGDLWVRPHGGDAPWAILRPPRSVQAELWRSLDDDPARKSASWSILRGGKGWKISDDEVVASGAGRIRFRADDGPITDRFLDGYPPALRAKMADSGGQHPVGDLRVAGEIRAKPGLEFLVIELTEGLRAYEFRLPGPAAPAGASAEIRVRDSGATSDGAGERVARADGVRLAAGDSARFAAENLDDRLTLELDGNAIVTLDVEPNAQQEAAITLGIDGEGAELEDLEVCRDIYYLPPDGRSWTVAIPPECYVMLGDNTQDSADSRLWRAKTYDYRGEKVRGNWREGGENPAYATLEGGATVLRFRDEWGEIHWLEQSALGGATLPVRNASADTVPNPPVPRELIVGRAVAVFWPIKPFQKLWRLGWLH